MDRRRWRVTGLTATAAILLLAFPLPLGAVRLAPQAASLPERLSDAEFWALSRSLSEPDGFFRSDNLVSNEMWLQWVIPDLVARVKPGGVYLGVGPEQNFTYIAAIKPRMVFLTDVRRGNLHMHLMYKALFEMSATRAEFLSRLFTKPRPAGVTEKTPATELINAFWDAQTSADDVFKTNLAALLNHLTRTRQMPLERADLEGIEYVYWSFFWYGPAINYSSSSGGRSSMASYGDLMLATDAAGVNRAFLANEDAFRVIKDLHQRNLIVPVVGNLAGPKALRAVGQYVRERGAKVTAMYLSNVEQYLTQEGIWGQFCANIATMPLDESSTFIRSARGGGGGRGGGSGLVNSLGGMLAETRGCAGRSLHAVVQ